MHPKKKENDMSTNKLVFSELFYHKSSALRVELNTYKDVTRFKFEIIPALKDEKGAPVLSASGKPKFNYKESFSMLFSHVELIRIKKVIEDILNPAKTNVPAEGYTLEHYFQVSNAQGVKEGKKSVATFKRMENNYKPKFPSPFEYKYVVGLSLYSSAKGGQGSIVLTEDEAYWLMNMLPLLILENLKENGRVANENKPAAGSTTTASAPAPQASVSVQASATPAAAQEQPEIPENWDDIPF